MKTGNLRVVIEWIGEGWQGDYDEEDPDDQRLARFSLQEERYGVDEDYGTDDGPTYWEDADDCSYCTQIAWDTMENNPEFRAFSEKFLLRQFEHDPPEYWKKIAERISWVDDETLMKFYMAQKESE